MLPMSGESTKTTPITYNKRFCPEGISAFDTVKWITVNAEIKDDKGKVLFSQSCEFPEFYSQTAVNIVASKYFYGPMDKRESSLKQVLDRVCGTIAKQAYIQEYFGPCPYMVDDLSIRASNINNNEVLNDRSIEDLATFIYGTPDSRDLPDPTEMQQINSAWKSYWAFRDDLTWLCLHQHMAFNSPVWFNVGTTNYGKAARENYAIDVSAVKHQRDRFLESRDHTLEHYHALYQTMIEQVDTYDRFQCSACFIQRVGDHLSDIMDLAKTEAILFKYGSGTGTDLSTLRSSGEFLSSGGRASGPLSFMRIYDQVAGVVKSGGKTRRAAKMQSLKIWHPDIEKFIVCKRDEELKGKILEKSGYGSGMDSDSYTSIFYQNANISVRITDKFMEAVKTGFYFDLVSPVSGKVIKTVLASKLWSDICQAAWDCADPGLQFEDEINRFNPVSAVDRINASNPCSEYMFIDDSACNLASLNLCRFADDRGVFNVERFKDACFTTLLAMETVVDASSYPTKKIALNSHLFRPLGLGYANLGALLMIKGLPYDSDEGRNVAACITSIMHNSALNASAVFARAKGPYALWEDTKKQYLSLLDTYRDSSSKLDWCDEFLDANDWSYTISMSKEYGLRNAQVTLLAPTGTIAFLMDCKTTGIEPDMGIVKYKNLAGGGMIKIVNTAVSTALDNLHYDDVQIKSIMDYIESHGYIDGCPVLKPEHEAVFDCAFAPIKKDGSVGRYISAEGHIKMMAACQPFLSGAISKTVNLPNHFTVEDISRLYMMSHQLKLKAVAIYRDGSKGTQAVVLNVDKKKKDTDIIDAKDLPKPIRRKVKSTCRCIRHRFSIDGHKGYLFISLFEDNTPGEIFIKMAKEGSTISGLMDSLAVSWSLAFQYGIPFRTMYNLYRNTKFSPSGYVIKSDDTEVKMPKMVTSIVDYIWRWLALNVFNLTDDISISDQEVKESPKLGGLTKITGETCVNCGSSNMIPSGKCLTCADCGTSGGCAG